MSILSQIAPCDPDGLMSIEIPTARAVSTPYRPTLGVADAPSESGRLLLEAKAISRTLLCGMGADDMAAAELEARVDEHVDVWTPTLHTATRFELISVMVDLDDAIGDVAMTFTEMVVTGSVAMLSWQVTARFLRPAFLDSDHLLEPTGAVLHLAGATSVSFTADGRADRIRCYYDRLALVEQIVSPHRGGATA